MNLRVVPQLPILLFYNIKFSDYGNFSIDHVAHHRNNRR